MKRWNTNQDKILLSSLMLLLGANYLPTFLSPTLTMAMSDRNYTPGSISMAAEIPKLQSEKSLTTKIPPTNVTKRVEQINPTPTANIFNSQALNLGLSDMTLGNSLGSARSNETKLKSNPTSPSPTATAPKPTPTDKNRTTDVATQTSDSNSSSLSLSSTGTDAEVEDDSEVVTRESTNKLLRVDLSRSGDNKTKAHVYSTEAEICADCDLNLEIDQAFSKNKNDISKILAKVNANPDYKKMAKKAQEQKKPKLKKPFLKDNVTEDQDDNTEGTTPVVAASKKGDKTPKDAIGQACEGKDKKDGSYLECANELLVALANDSGAGELKSMKVTQLFNKHVKPSLEKMLDSGDTDRQDEALEIINNMLEGFDGDNAKSVVKQLLSLRFKPLETEAKKVAEVDREIKSLPDNDPRKFTLTTEKMMLLQNLQQRLNSEAYTAQLNYGDMIDLDGKNMNTVALDYYKNFTSRALHLQTAVLSEDPFTALQANQDLSKRNAERDSYGDGNGRGRNARAGNIGSFPDFRGRMDSGRYNQNYPLNRGSNYNQNYNQYEPTPNYRSQRGYAPQYPYQNRGGQWASTPSSRGGNFYQNQYSPQNNRFQQPNYNNYNSYNNYPPTQYNSMMPFNNMNSGFQPRF